MTALLARGDLLRSTRLLLAVTAATAGMAPLIVVTTSARSVSTPVIASLLGCGYVALSAGFFATRWPTRRQSAMLAAGGALIISAWSLAQSDPTLQFLACAVMIIPGAYLAIFHSTKMMLPSVLAAAVTAIAAALHAGHQTGTATAAASFSVLWLLNLAIPLAARNLSRAMTRYAADSHYDPLTGLLNRRGFTQRLNVLPAPVTGRTFLAVLLVDVDGFKTFNDTHGHPQGDQLLIALAELLRRSSPADAAICRAGGEEFLIAYTTTDPGPPPIAPQLCTLISELPHTITASIGTSTIALDTNRPHASLDTAIAAADTAMYNAKRNGGNHTTHSTTPTTHPKL